MNIALTDITNVLSLYGIHAAVLNHNFFIEGFDEESEELKYIAKAELTDNSALVVKFIRQVRNPYSAIEEQSRFSEQIRSHGILTPKRYKSGDNYCITYPFNGLVLDVTVEDYIGEEITGMNNNLSFQIGQLMGKMHRIAQNDNLHINNQTMFNVVGDNDISGYDEFIRFGNNDLIDNGLFNQICLAYNERLNRLKKVWNCLPIYATQGDYSTNNLTYIGGELAIFDYNNAGDVALISDMILEGLLTVYENDLADSLSEAEKHNLFQCFVDGYVSQRPLSENEKAVFVDIYATAKSMWFTRILYSEHSLAKLIEKNEYEKVTALLQDIYKDITTIIRL